MGGRGVFGQLAEYPILAVWECQFHAKCFDWIVFRHTLYDFESVLGQEELGTTQSKAAGNSLRFLSLLKSQSFDGIVGA